MILLKAKARTIWCGLLCCQEAATRRGLRDRPSAECRSRRCARTHGLAARGEGVGALSGRLTALDHGGPPYPRRRRCRRVRRPHRPSWADGEQLLPRCGDRRRAGQPCGFHCGRASGSPSASFERSRGDLPTPNPRPSNGSGSSSARWPPGGGGRCRRDARLPSGGRTGGTEPGAGPAGFVSSRDELAALRVSSRDEILEVVWLSSRDEMGAASSLISSWRIRRALAWVISSILRCS